MRYVLEKEQNEEIILESFTQLNMALVRARWFTAI